MIARRESKENRRIYNVKMMHRGEAELDKMERVQLRVQLRVSVVMTVLIGHYSVY